MIRPAAFILLMAAWGTAGLPWLFDLAAGIAVALVCRRVSKTDLIVLVAATLLSLFFLETAVRWWPTQPVVHYREHEKFLEGGRYRAEVDEYVDVLHGDLLALDNLAPATLKEPRRIRFKTDRQGYRNDHEYQGREIILVGDSVIVANGSDQAFTPANILEGEHGLPAYTLSLAGDPADYCRRLNNFLPRLAPEARAIMFLFEGNDFRAKGRTPDVPSGYDRFKVAYLRLINLKYPRLLFNATRRLGWNLNRDTVQPVVVHRLAGREVGFYGSYIDRAVAEAPELKLKDGDCPPPVLARLLAVVFIPTKYRVYAGHIRGDQGWNLPEPAPGYLAAKRYFERFRLPVHDLTPALRQRADDLLPQGRLVYWRDDTHLNPAGLEVLAAQTARIVRGEQAER
ncbi:MAG: hypothetical protein AB1641_01470 [Thermodesulfobacteriota bacterium]